MMAFQDVLPYLSRCWLLFLQPDADGSLPPSKMIFLSLMMALTIPMLMVCTPPVMLALKALLIS
jgi:hypothetical protein